jgi:hypothetical protein
MRSPVSHALPPSVQNRKVQYCPGSAWVEVQNRMQNCTGCSVQNRCRTGAEPGVMNTPHTPYRLAPSCSVGLILSFADFRLRSAPLFALGFGTRDGARRVKELRTGASSIAHRRQSQPNCACTSVAHSLPNFRLLPHAACRKPDDTQARPCQPGTPHAAGCNLPRGSGARSQPAAQLSQTRAAIGRGSAAARFFAAFGVETCH